MITASLFPAGWTPPKSKVGPRHRWLAFASRPYDASFVTIVRTIPGRTFRDKERDWVIPIRRDNAAMIAHIIRDYQVSADETIRELIRDVLTAGAEAETASERTTGATHWEIPGLVREPFPYQRTGIDYICDNAAGVLVGDQMGLGKTGEAICALQALGAFPALILCPQSIKINWEREFKAWLGDTKRIIRLTGSPSKTVTPDALALGLEEYDVIVINYDILERWYPVLTLVRYKGAVADESHYLKGWAIFNTKKGKITGPKRAYYGKQLVKRATVARIAMSGTPIKNRPEELPNQLDAIDRLDDFGGYFRFVRDYCGASQTVITDKTGAPALNPKTGKPIKFMSYNPSHEQLATMFQKLRSTCYLRREKNDDGVWEDMPDKTIVPLYLDIDNRAEYTRAEKDVIAYLQKEFGDERAVRAARAEHLARIEVLKQLAYKGKRAQIQSWIEDFLATGEKLIIFATHRDAQHDLYEWLVGQGKAQGYGVRAIFGDEPNQAKRQQAVDDFQTDPSVRVIVCSMIAAGIGITLTAATAVLMCEFGWTPADHEQAEDRAHRQGQRFNVTVYEAVGDNTIDVDINELLALKRDVVRVGAQGQAPVAGSAEEREYGHLGADLIRRMLRRATKA